MWRLRYWLSCLSPSYLLFRLGVRLWLRYGGEKIYIAFRHTKCRSEVVQLADFRPWVGPEFQCFNCSALVPVRDITFRILSAEEVEKAKAESAKDEDYPSKEELNYYFKSAALPHLVA